LDGSFGSQNFQVGANAHETIGLAINSAQTDDLGSARTSLDVGSLIGVSTAAAANSDASNALLDMAASHTITIDGVNEQTVTLGQSDSASQMATKINAEFNTTGVKADAKTTAVLSGFAGLDSTANGSDGMSFDLSNGTATETISFTAQGNTTDDMQLLVNKINEVSATTGISAKFDSTGGPGAIAGIILESEAGDTITISDFSDDDASGGANAATFNISGAGYDGDITGAAANAITAGVGGAGNTDSISIRGSIQLNSTVGFDVATSNAELGPTSQTQATEISVDTVDLTTAQGAQDAISVIDGALAKIDRNRATLGAVQNRLQSTINNLSSIAENSSAARSRIRDTDFASETAELTRNQILQQAGTTILAQANQLPQAALSLLGG
ncbi:MAG: flagellin, partial [Gammaproteobacteria bacterium]|nr:flagellin [Gammaproteobacteria bacterium]